jgi:hypothetical protein
MRLLHLPVLLHALTFELPAAIAQDLPRRKAGLWEITTAHPAGPMLVEQHCIDAKTDRPMRLIFPRQDPACLAPTIRRDGQTIVVDGVCDPGPSRRTIRAAITGDFNSAYSVEVTTAIRRSCSRAVRRS